MTASDALRGKSAHGYRFFSVSFSVVIASLAAMLALASPASAASPPSIESTSVSNITSTDATFEAQINPNGLETTYEVKLEAPACGPGFCETTGGVVIATGTLPASFSTQDLSVDIASAWGHLLSPSTRYGYSVNATNSAGERFWSGNYKVFETLAGIPPAIESVSVSHITATDATLEAQIDPGGLETSYEFRLETPECQMMEGPGPAVGCQVVGTGTIPAGSSTQTVSTDIAKAWEDLTPNTTYMFAVFARNSAGEAPGRHEAWFTTATAAPPSIESESVSNITPTDATLEATINTEGLKTTYTFYLHEEGPPCLEADPPCMVLEQAPIPLPSGQLLGSFVGQNVSADLNSAGVSLTPGKSYEYWLTATSTAGTTKGQAQSFTAPSEPGAEPLTEPNRGTDPQASTTIQSPTSGAPPHHRRQRNHRRHRRGLRWVQAYRARHAG
jgi:hypothetical protein